MQALPAPAMALADGSQDDKAWDTRGALQQRFIFGEKNTHHPKASLQIVPSFTTHGIFSLQI
eukprot:6489150-Amphidinium_carterae.1